jgi:hypothetical protein
VAARADVTVGKNRETGSRDCGGGVATVDGNDADLTLENCKTVNVNGNGNRLAVGAVESLTVMGNRNTVTWTVGPKDRRPRISNLGSGNRISEAGGHAGAGPSVAIDPDGGVSVGGVAVGGVAAAAASAVTVVKSEDHATYDCKGGGASVTGNDNELVLRIARPSA